MEAFRVPVSIVGAGPVGLSLALGLARQGIRSLILEKEERTSERSRAPGIHIRTREVFRQWGVEKRIVEAGELLTEVTAHDVLPYRPPLFSLDLGELETEAASPGLLILEQGRTEKILLDTVRETGMSEVRFGAEAVGLDQREDGVRLTFREGTELRTVEADYLVGCDGASSFVREALGLPFEGLTYSLRPTLADVRLSDARDSLPWPRVRNASGGLTFTARLSPGLWRIVRLERGDPEHEDEVPDHELRRLVDSVLGSGDYERVWASRFRIHRRASRRFRVGRVLLAGDAAHVHSPAGGQGMNSGIQDAHNLAWKLALTLEGGDPDRLLDSYDAERRWAVVGSVSRYTDFITRAFLQTPAAVRYAAFFLWRQALRIPAARSRALRRMTMIDLDYPPARSTLLQTDWPAAGVRLPNPLLRDTHGHAVRLYDLIRYAPALVRIGDPGTAPALGSSILTIHIGAVGYEDPAGVLTALLEGMEGWILVRPDAHIAWTGDDPDELAIVLARALGERIY